MTEGSRPLVVDCDWTGRLAPEALLGVVERTYAAGLAGGRRTEWVRTRLTAKAAVHWAVPEVTGAEATPDTEPQHTAAVEILPDPDGAPRSRGGPHGLALSLAHTGELAACAVTQAGAASLIGVDVEPVDAYNDILLPRLLAPDEPLPLLGPGPRPGMLATVLVAVKEAALKAYRRPSPALRTYVLRRDDEGVLSIRATALPHEGLRVWWSCRDGLVTAVCAVGDQRPEHHVVTPGEVLTALTAAPSGFPHSQCSSASAPTGPG